MTKEEQIIKFKQDTPAAILGSFKGDDDIWDYINHTGRWVEEFQPKRITIETSETDFEKMKADVTGKVKKAFGIKEDN